MKGKNKILTAYLKSKEIYTHQILSFFYKNGVYFFKISSSSDNRVYEVIIDLNHLIFSCECNFFVNSLSLEDYIEIGNKKIYICKHIIKALEFISKFDERAKEVLERIKKSF